MKAKASATLSPPAGRGSSSICVKADGRDKLRLDARLSHLVLREEQSVLLGLNLSQSLLPRLTDLRVKMAAHTSGQRHVSFLACFPPLMAKHPYLDASGCFWMPSSASLHASYAEGRNTLLARVEGSQRNSSGLRWTLSGTLRHSMTGLALLPSILGLEVTLGRSDSIAQGKTRSGFFFFPLFFALCLHT